MENDSTHKSNLFNSVINAGQSTLNAIWKINCGAVIAVLTLIYANESHIEEIANLVNCALIFAIGVAVSAIAFGTTYIAQLFYASDKYHKGLIAHYITVILVISGHIAFILGIIKAYLILA